MDAWKVTGIVLASILALLGVVAIFRRKGTTIPGGNTAEGVAGAGGCIKAPARFERWSGNFSGTDWGAYGSAIREELNRNPETERDAIDNFFKAIDVEPKSGYVRYFKNQIREFINSPNAQVPHWQTEAGYLRCN